MVINGSCDAYLATCSYSTNEGKAFYNNNFRFKQRTGDVSQSHRLTLVNDPEMIAVVLCDTQQVSHDSSRHQVIISKDAGNDGKVKR